jgi:hypothetical protein
VAALAWLGVTTTSGAIGTTGINVINEGKEE